MLIGLIGAFGQLGHDLLSLLSQSIGGIELGKVTFSSADLDICNLNALDEFMSTLTPDVLISTAAYNRVDDCETDQARAFEVNALGSRYLAEVCAKYETCLVWFSTDFVFDGKRSTPFLEDDPVSPLSLYGCSKAAGEMLIRATTDKHVIIRTSSLYGVVGSRGKGGNFVKSIIAKLSMGESPLVVDELTMSPTYTRDLASEVIDIVKSGQTGTFHAANSGSCSWYEFACEIAEQSGYADVPIYRQPAGYTGIAKRPAYSVLASSRRPPLRSWKRALADYLQEAKAKGSHS